MPSHGAALPDISRPSGFLGHKNDPAPVAALVTEAENYVRASDPLMAGMGDGSVRCFGPKITARTWWDAIDPANEGVGGPNW